jgi:hypothetical protein
MGSRCHYPFWDKGSVCAHLLSTHRSRTVQDISWPSGPEVGDPQRLKPHERGACFWHD